MTLWQRAPDSDRRLLALSVVQGQLSVQISDVVAWLSYHNYQMASFTVFGSLYRTTIKLQL